MSDLPVVLIFAPRSIRLQSPANDSARFAETRKFDCRHYASDENLNRVLTRERPDVIVSFGRRQDYPRLESAPLDVRKKRLHFEAADLSESDLESVGAMVFGFFLHRALSRENESSAAAEPLVSVFTPAFRTGERRIRRAFQSLLAQTYTNWEWVVADDSADDGATLRSFIEIAEEEPRLSIYLPARRSGKIGEVKRRCCALARGEILVELDHDDELASEALSDIVQTFRADPKVGFVYTDWAELSDDDGTSLRYPDGWAFGYGGYRTENYAGRELHVAEAPPINAETVQHIAGMPNHARAWRRDEYWRIGGHNPNLHVADDYELLLRTFLQTEMKHISELCYIQYLCAGKNTQDVRRAEIQRMVRHIYHFYQDRVQARINDIERARHSS